MIVLVFLTCLVVVPHETVRAQTREHFTTQLIPNCYNNVTDLNLNLTISSPENKTYNTINVPLNFILESNAEPSQLVVYGNLFGLYSAPIVALDQNTNNVTNIIENGLYWQLPEDAPAKWTKIGSDLFSGNATFSNLSQGNHNVTIGVEAVLDYISYDVPVGYSFTTISFSIDTIPPSVSILSLQNKTYATGDIPIEFNANKTLSLISYSFDGRENITTQGNFTLDNLANGYHNLTVYCTDEAGNIGSQSVTFTVEKPEFGNVLIVAIIAIPIVIICLVAGLLLFRRHRKTAKLKQ